MKRTLQIIISASAASVLACSALAQDSPKTKPDRVDYARHDRMQERPALQLNGAAKASDVIGMTVNDNQNKKLATVEDVAVDVESGRIVQVILSTGGILGFGDTLTAVPPGALRHDVTNNVLHLDADQAKLKSAPKFEMTKWAECSDANHVSAVYRHYGHEPAFNFIHKGDAVLDGLRSPDGQVIKNGQTKRENDDNTVATRNADKAQNEKARSTRNQSMIPASRLGHVQKASALMDMSVRNLQKEELGEVNNILLDLPSGRIVAIIISSGGFLGIGDELSAVPSPAFRFNENRDMLQLDASKEALAKAPHFKSNQWPDVGNPVYADGVYRAYNIEPYFTTNVTTAADNTSRNALDRKDRTLTPLDQGNSKADLATTAQIRQEIMAGKDMSVNAQNVKIVTNQGQVTLRGPVNSEDEKQRVGKIANKIARAENVDNQLEVRLTTSSNK